MTTGHLRTQLRQLLLISRLRLRARVRSFRKGPVTLCSVGCSPSEVSAVAGINATEVIELADYLRDRSRSRARVPRIRVLCIGANQCYVPLPRLVRQFGEHGMYGLWLFDHNLCIVCPSKRASLRRLVFHEVTHGVLERLAGSYQYPAAIGEGYARAMEIRACGLNNQRDAGARCASLDDVWTRTLSEHEAMTLRDLVSFDSWMHWHREDWMGFIRMSNTALRLHEYLSEQAQAHPRVGELLPELRARNVRSPEAFLDLLLELTEMTEQGLATELRSYCHEIALPTITSNWDTRVGIPEDGFDLDGPSPN